jgi:DNA-directed RNA polymerase subunit beta'
MRQGTRASGQDAMVIIEHKGELHPQITVRDDEGKPVDVQYLSERAIIKVKDGDEIAAGTCLAENPRETGGVSDITGGLPRVTEICEARKPKDPAVIAEVDGEVEILNERKRGKRTIVVRSESGIEREHTGARR